MFFIFLLPAFIPGIVIFALGMYYWVWPKVKDMKENMKDEGFFKTMISWEIFYLLLRVLVVSAVAAIVNIAILYVLFKPQVQSICRSDWAQLLLALGPLVLEIAGYVLTPIGIGVPIVGAGMFLEIFSTICDWVEKDWMDVILSLLGLIPIGGLPFGVGKTFKKVTRFF